MKDSRHQSSSFIVWFWGFSVSWSRYRDRRDVTRTSRRRSSSNVAAFIPKNRDSKKVDLKETSGERWSLLLIWTRFFIAVFHRHTFRHIRSFWLYCCRTVCEGGWVFCEEGLDGHLGRAYITQSQYFMAFVSIKLTNTFQSHALCVWSASSVPLDQVHDIVPEMTHKAYINKFAIITC